MALPKQLTPGALLIATLLLTVPAGAQSTIRLENKTLDAFNRFTSTIEQDIEKRVRGNKPFLWVDDDPTKRGKLRQGEILVHQFGGKTIDVPDGLVHHWIGSMFIAGGTMKHTLAVLRDVDRHKDIYGEVIESQLIADKGQTVLTRIKILRKKILTAVLIMDLESVYQAVGENRCFIDSVSTKMREVRESGTANEKVLPDGEGTGFLWRQNSYWRLEQAEDGIFVELESLSLTRNVPFLLGFIIKPFIQDIPRESLVSTLQATRLAVTNYE